jgi:uncharacterized Tic20 family protein
MNREVERFLTLFFVRRSAWIALGVLIVFAVYIYERDGIMGAMDEEHARMLELVPECRNGIGKGFEDVAVISTNRMLTGCAGVIILGEKTSFSGSFRSYGVFSDAKVEIKNASGRTVFTQLVDGKVNPNDISFKRSSVSRHADYVFEISIPNSVANGLSVGPNGARTVGINLTVGHFPAEVTKEVVGIDAGLYGERSRTRVEESTSAVYPVISQGEIERLKANPPRRQRDWEMAAYLSLHAALVIIISTVFGPILALRQKHAQHDYGLHKLPEDLFILPVGLFVLVNIFLASMALGVLLIPPALLGAGIFGLLVLLFGASIGVTSLVIKWMSGANDRVKGIRRGR